MEGGAAMNNTPGVRNHIVLVALDGSPAAATALPVARAVAAQLHATIQVLHAEPSLVDEAELRRQLRLTDEDLAQLEIRQYVGEPAAGILQAAADPAVLLVVLTTHGRAIEPGRRLGRVAEAVIAAAMQPILLVRPEAATQPGARASALTRLLVPLDGTPTTAAALRPATEIAVRLGASLDLLFVAAPGAVTPPEPGSIGAPCYVDQPQHEWPQWTKEVIEWFSTYCAASPPDVPVHMYLAQGADIGSVIAQFAAEHGDSAIVLVRRSRLEPGRARILRAVLDQTPCPILLVGCPDTDASLGANGDHTEVSHESVNAP
jgi:nucleotide-binding universal stress UspA family protein